MKTAGRMVDLFFMPWLQLVNDITVGDVSFVPAPSLLASLDDTKVAQHIRRVLACYVDEIGEPMPRATVCYHVNHLDFSDLSEDEFPDMRRAADVLCFASMHHLALYWIGQDEPCKYWGTQAFDLIRHPASTMSDGFRLRKPYVECYCTYDRFRSVRPLGLTKLTLGYSRVMMDAFSKLFKSDDSSLRERVFRSLEWARFAHDDTGAVSDSSKIVMMGTALEILLHVRADKKKLHMMKEVDHLCKSNCSVTRTKDVDRQPCEFSQMAWWMHDFYDLRNAIVHGDAIDWQRLYVLPPTEQCRGIAHMEVADIVLGDCAWALLRKKKVIGDDCKRLAALLKQTGCNLDHVEIVKQYTPVYTGSREVQERLGWYSMPE